MISARRAVLSFGYGVALTILAICLAAMNSNSHGLLEKASSLLLSPGIGVSRNLFGMHSLGFLVVAFALNATCWAVVSYMAMTAIAGIAQGRAR
jgi:hypothetical protein